MELTLPRQYTLCAWWKMMASRESNSRCVFVGNIPYEATEAELAEIFKEVGPVVSFRSVENAIIILTRVQTCSRPRHWKAKGLWLLRVSRC